jgi:hypothetical protein
MGCGGGGRTNELLVFNLSWEIRKDAVPAGHRILQALIRYRIGNASVSKCRIMLSNFSSSGRAGRAARISASVAARRSTMR